ncbi:polycystin-1-like [Ambystoma mexicanum]|uniref:polycystin-1-like n=1 Tax=Ambystoma mexicanum TaxID=8296 RepID=UPI0037E96DBA
MLRQRAVARVGCASGTCLEGGPQARGVGRGAKPFLLVFLVFACLGNPSSSEGAIPGRNPTQEGLGPPGEAHRGAPSRDTHGALPTGVASELGVESFRAAPMGDPSKTSVPLVSRSGGALLTGALRASSGGAVGNLGAVPLWSPSEGGEVIGSLGPGPGYLEASQSQVEALAGLATPIMSVSWSDLGGTGGPITHVDTGPPKAHSVQTNSSDASRAAVPPHGNCPRKKWPQISFRKSRHKRETVERTGRMPLPTSQTLGGGDRHPRPGLASKDPSEGIKYLAPLPPSQGPEAGTEPLKGLRISQAPGAGAGEGTGAETDHLRALPVGQAGTGNANGGQILPGPHGGCRQPGGCDETPEEVLGPAEHARPCPEGCICNTTTANCSRLQLVEVPSRESFPPGTVILDLSHNLLREVQVGDFAGFPELIALDLSFNRIRTIQEGAFQPLRQLQCLKLGSNSLVCDCSLSWLAAWVRERGDLIQDHQLLRCSYPSTSSSADNSSDLLRANFTAQPCADSYISCVADPKGTRDAALYFSMISLEPHTPGSCHELCFQDGQSYYGLDEKNYCLCGSLGTKGPRQPQMGAADQDCTAVCSNTVQSQVCGRTVIHTVHAVQATLTVSAPRHSSVHQSISLTASAMPPAVLYHWDFGDGGGLLTTSRAQASHKYTLPGAYNVTAWTEVGVTVLRGWVEIIVSMPVSLGELECPAVVETGHNIDIWMHVQHGTELFVLWKSESLDGLQTLDETSCPRGGRVHLENLNCYWLVQTKESWKEAKQLCQATPGGDLALVKSENVLPFLQEAFPGAGSVWIGLDEPISSAPLDSFKNWGVAGHPEKDKDCIHLNTDLKGASNSSPCQRKSSFLCQKRAGSALPSGELFLTGVPAFTAAYTVKNASSGPVLPLLGTDTVELMLFPGLWFSHAGTLMSLEFGLQALKKSSQVRFQVFRPYCNPSQHLVPPGCELLQSPFASCQSRPLCNTTGGCPTGQQWCPLREMCLSITSPCSTYAFENVTSNILPIPNPPRFPGTSPFYSQVADVPLILGPGTDNYHTQVLLSAKEIAVYPDDIIGIQHTAGVDALLHCQPSRDSPWRQSYIRLTRGSWWEGGGLFNSTWVDNVICDLRVTYAYDLRSIAMTPLLSGQAEPGFYLYTAIIHNMVSETQVSCLVDTQSRVGGLQIIHPVPVNGKLHIATQHKTLLVIKILSGTNATVYWMAPIGRAGLPFQSSCPTNILATVPACRRDTADSWFSSIWALLSDRRDETLNILVSNQISSQNLSVKIQSHDPITNLQVTSPGSRRMLVDVTQVFSANVGRGSSVSYTWMVDDQESFAYTGPTYSLRLRKPGTYTLKLRADNPVSSDTVELLLTADTMHRLHDPHILRLPEVVTVNGSQRLTFGVKVDMAVEVTVRWHFGDGTAVLEDPWSPPYDPKVLQLDPNAEIVSIVSNVTHTYTQPGDYNVTVQAFNNYESVQQVASLRVLCPLASLYLLASPAAPLVNQTILFEARPTPSAFGVSFSWDFGDGTPQRMVTLAMVQHSFSKSGQYRVRVGASHSLNTVFSEVLVQVGQSVMGLEITSNGPNELGTPTTINATVASGTDVQWSWDMGDGSEYRKQSSSSISHTFTREGNYTVGVTASNRATSACAHINVEVYKLQITQVLAPTVVASRNQIRFQAFVTGPVDRIHFHWDFGDHSYPVVMEQNPIVYHSYATAGKFLLNLTVSGMASTDLFQSTVYVQDPILSVKVRASPQIVALGDPVSFSATVIPAPDPLHQYNYNWDAGLAGSPVPSSSPEMTFTYMEEGMYQVTFTAWNSVGSQNASIQVTAKIPIGPISILHSGETGEAFKVNYSYCFSAEVIYGVVASFTWDFGDSSPEEPGRRACHSYRQAGNTTISVTGQNPVSRQAATLLISVLTPVTSLSVRADSTVGEVGEAITFQAFLLAGDRIQYLWAACDSCSFTEGLSTLDHRFMLPGVFTVRVQVKNAVSVDEASLNIEIQERVHGLRVRSSDVVQERYVAATEPFTLTVKVGRGSNVTFRWVISHGSSRLLSTEGPSVTFSCNCSGILLVEVWAGNRLGEVSESLMLHVMERVGGVVVRAPPKSASVGSTVNLTASVSSGTDLLYTWYPGEGPGLMSCNHSALSYVYRSPGTRRIFVTVSNILGSANGSTELRVEEPVTGVDILILGLVPPFLLRSNSTVHLQGSAVKGTDMLWEWHLQKKKEVQLFHKQNISIFLGEPGVYQLELRAWNNISCDVTGQAIRVQQKVSGLTLQVDKAGACTSEVFHFSLSVLRGTNVSFVLNVTSLGLVIDAPDGKVPLAISVPGQHLVSATAYNELSHETASLLVQVLEQVTGLHLSDCCPPVLDVTKPLELRAAVLTGDALVFSWAFVIPGHRDHSATGQHVLYNPAGVGNLTIRVEARNHFCWQSVAANITLQSPVTSVTLSSNGTQAFVNQIVAFWAAVEGGSDLNFHWHFGDSRESFTSADKMVFHKYTHSGDFSAEVRVFNAISFGVAHVTLKVKKLECNEPRVELVPPPSTIAASQHSYFEATVDLKTCTAYAAQHLWEVYHSPDCQSLLPADRVYLRQVDMSTPLLLLPKHCLQAGVYCLRFSLSIQGTPLSRSISLPLRVLHSELVPVIQGGSHRSWSAELDLLMDGSGSYDPDSELAKDAAPLEYHWNWETKNVSALCAHHTFPPKTGTNITIPSTMLCVGATYVFTLTVKKEGRQPASTTQTVWIQSGAVLPVVLECRSCSVMSSYKVSRSVHVTLSAQCEDCHNATQYKWTAQSSSGQPLTLDNVTTSTGDANRDLVIRQGVLQDGINYTFTVAVFQPGSHLWGGSSITLTTNNPPSKGSCGFYPEKNIFLLETMVSYNCSGWTDEDGSLGQVIYTLLAETCSLGQCQRFCLYRGTKSSVSTLLPAGNSTAHSTVTVYLEVEDLQGAKTVALNRTLTVTMPPVSGFQTVTGWLKNKSQSELWGLVRQGNPQELIPYSLALVSALNQELDGGGPSSENDREDRLSIRSNVTEALTSLKIGSVKDVTQLSAALSQCVAVPEELSSESRARVLEAAERMIRIVSMETEEGHETPVHAGRNILAILGRTVAALDSAPRSGLSGVSLSGAAVSTFSLTRDLVKSLMRSRVLNEETLSLSVDEIHVQGKRAISRDLLCTEPSEKCLFFLPDALAAQLAESGELVQVVVDYSFNPFPFRHVTNTSISTRLASLEFSTPLGMEVPISDLSGEKAIYVRMPARDNTYLNMNNSETMVTIPAGESVNFTVTAESGSSTAGVHIHMHITLPMGFDPTHESNPSLSLHGHDTSLPSGLLPEWTRKVTFSRGVGGFSREVTVLISRGFNGSSLNHHVNISSHFGTASARVVITVLSSLCQYFHMPSQSWRTEGVTSTDATNDREVMCRTEHLTLFGASLFVPLHTVVFLPPHPVSRQSHLVLITCAVFFCIYLVMVLIAHKLDDIDITRVGIIPLCGQPGRYKYWVMVKTGWKQGSGTTAHIGISLYGLNKSGSRHLDKSWAFQRNSQDTFQVETDANLGEIWKIRIWHDNTGLDPSWYLQHVIVWDKQTDVMYYFLVEDWLSVENEKNEGMVEKEVLAACPQELRSFSRIFPAQLRLGFSDWHLWWSVWSRPPHSRFTRVQRITCCMCTLYLFLATCVLWYGSVGVAGNSVPLGSQLLVSVESIAVGMVVAVVILPVQLLFTFLFRQTRSKVVVEDTEPPTLDSQTIEMDVCLDITELGSSSFLSIPRGLESMMDVSSLSGESFVSRKQTCSPENPVKLDNESLVRNWPSCDSMFDIPDLLNSDPLMMMSRSRILKRKKALLTLGIESPSSSDDDPMSFSDSSRKSSCDQLSLSEEDLLNSIVTDARKSKGSDRVTSDSGRFSPRAETDLISDILESRCSSWSDAKIEPGRSSWGFLRKSFSYASMVTSMGSILLPDLEAPSPPATSFSTRIGIPHGRPAWLFPSWMLLVTYTLLFLCMALCLSMLVLYGSTLPERAVLMWFISSAGAVLTSFVLMEPLKVVLEALRAALLTKPVHSEAEGLVEKPLIRTIPERVGKVRAPCGYGLLQAKEEARKVRALRGLMKSCLLHMLFLLVVLVVNYQGCIHDSNIRLLHTAIKRSITAETANGLVFTSIQGTADLWRWIDSALLPHLYGDSRAILVGAPRIRQICSTPDLTVDLAAPAVRTLSMSRATGGNGILWNSAAGTSWIGHLEGLCSNDTPSNSSEDPVRFWFFGHLGVYGSNEGSWWEFDSNLLQTRKTLRELQSTNWISTRSRAVFVEFTQYHPDVDLYISVSLLTEFPPVGPAAHSTTILPFHLPQLTSTLDLPLAMMALLFLFSVGFLVPELLASFSHEHGCHQTRWHFWLQLLLVLLSVGVGTSHYVCIWLSGVRLEHYRKNRQLFTSFYEVALLAKLETCLSASLLLVTMLKMVRQLRFIRRWSVFGKTFSLALGELLSATSILLFLLLVYAQCGYLAFSHTNAEFRTFHAAFFTLLSVLHGRVSLRPLCQASPAFGGAFLLSYVVSILGIGSRLLCIVILRSYHIVHADMYRPTVEPQDYEMIEFCMKRFKLWLGLSKAKEFRHKVKFEGMESLPSRSSQHSKRSSLPTAGTTFHRSGSSISSSSFHSEDMVLPDSPAPELHPAALYLERLPSTVNNLLDQFDRVNRVLEDVCRLETGLEQVQKRINTSRKAQKKKDQLQAEKKVVQKTVRQLDLPRTYSTFSESALARMKSSRVKVSTIDGNKLFQQPSAADALGGQRSWLSGPPGSYDLCMRLGQGPGAPWKWRPKSEEGQGGMCRDIAQRHVPLKRRAWQTEGQNEM